MKKMRVAIIGQGRSGHDIHSNFLRSSANTFAEVVAIVDELDFRREIGKREFGCDLYSDYRELFGRDDIDLVVNSTYSNQHYSVAKDLLKHGFNVLSEKPFARSLLECMDLIKTAKENGKIVTAFHQSLCIPVMRKLKEIMASGIIGDIMQISLRYSSFGRRWDWQTLQYRCAGSVYNSGPHPIGQALEFLDWDKNTRVAYASLRKALTLGDAEDYGKIILTSPGKPTIDIEIIAADAYADPYNFKVFGTNGTVVATNSSYKMKYIDRDKLEDREVMHSSLVTSDGMPIFCREELPIIEVEEDLGADCYDIANLDVYTQLYNAIMLGKPLEVTPEKAAMVVNIIDTCHAMNPLPLIYSEE
ncbi:MAG: Gfo/Idh/MocA family oxidoreductase [Ruminococcaceae bacterium]|nr:Gfo/Idh/MocA family oxidoreductase [Oscillospiraceae bacterium]